MRGRLLLLVLLAACSKASVKDPSGVLEAAGEVRFGETPLLGQADAQLVLKNTGKGTLRVDLATHAPFTVEPARVEVEPGRYGLATVHFTPTFEGEILRTLSLAHRGGGTRQVLLVGTGRCACDDHDALTTDLCGDLGECQHLPVTCSEAPPPCWRLEPSRERGCDVVPEPDGTACIPADGLCGGGATCREGACVLAPPRALVHAWSVPIGAGEAVASPSGDVYAVGRAGELLRVSAGGASTTLARDLPAGAELVLLQGDRLLVRAGLEVEGRDLDGQRVWGGELPGGTTEPWRFAASAGGMWAVGGARTGSCDGTVALIVPISPASGPAPSAAGPAYAPTGIAIDQTGVLRISGESCTGQPGIFTAEQILSWQLGDTDLRVLSAQGSWTFSGVLQLETSGSRVESLPAVDPFDPVARTLEPLAGLDGGWLFDCTGEACDAPAVATFFSPGFPGAGWQFDLGARPSGLLLEGAELLVASERSLGGASLLHARPSGDSETCAVPEGMVELVTLAGGALVAVVPDPSGGRMLAGFPAPGLALASEGWVVHGGTPGKSRRPIDLP